jgi:hypothetical protein
MSCANILADWPVSHDSLITPTVPVRISWHGQRRKLLLVVVVQLLLVKNLLLSNGPVRHNILNSSTGKTKTQVAEQY